MAEQPGRYPDETEDDYKYRVEQVNAATARSDRITAAYQSGTAPESGATLNGWTAAEGGGIGGALGRGAQTVSAYGKDLFSGGLSGVGDSMLAKDLGGLAKGAAGMIGGKIGAGLSDMVSTRLNASNLANIFGFGKKTPQVLFSGGSKPTDGQNALTTDWRIRLSVGAGSNILYEKNQDILKPLTMTNGLMFPITPQIQLTYTAKYDSSTTIHSNYSMGSYTGSEVSEISINAEFPIQNTEQGKYLLAAIYFLRASTKMFWGNDELAGTPPPVLFLNGYGKHYFPNVPVVVTSFMHSMPQDADYIEIPHATGSTRLPVLSQLQVQVKPTYSRSKLYNFTVDGLLKGEFL